jgi:glycosyltransferase involved in cell wall biosynthesis
VTAGAPRAAFYTPLKHPFEREASGEREIARTLLAGLRRVGVEPELASRLLTWRREFHPAAAERLSRQAAIIATTLVRRYRRRPAASQPRLWVTYQNYYRCPDLIGPAVSLALGIPYVLIDPAVSTASRRTAFRPWVSAARLALRQAALIFAMSPRDLPRLARLRGRRFAEAHLLLLPPAVEVSRFSDAAARRADVRRRLVGSEPTPVPLLLCVAMMRMADKLDSYRLLAAALTRLHDSAPDRPWRLVVVGDGPARREVETALAELPGERVTVLGAVEPDGLPPLYLAADLFVFPGLGEALGLVFLEAAAAGLPVVACHGPGPDYMVRPETGILTAATATALGDGIRALLDQPARARALGAAGRRVALAERSVEALERRLGEGLARLGLP